MDGENLVRILKDGIREAYAEGVKAGRAAAREPDYTGIAKGATDDGLLSIICKGESAQDYRNACADELVSRLGVDEFAKRLKAQVAKQAEAAATYARVRQ